MVETGQTTTPQNVGNVQLETSLLIRLIPNFDGSFDQLISFIDNVNNAYNIANSSQKEILLPFIKAALKGSAQNIVQTRSYDSWDALKAKLKEIYGEKKSFAQVQIELQNTRQSRDETIASFTQKIEAKIQKLLATLKLETDKAVDESQQELIEKMGLTTFIHNCLPQYGQLLRIRNPKSIVEASRLATDEELAIKFQKMQTYNQNSFRNNNNANYNGINKNKSKHHTFNNSNNKKVFIAQKLSCTYCKKEGHTIDYCFKKKLTCNFCKKNGHSESNCFTKNNTNWKNGQNPKNGQNSKNGWNPKNEPRASTSKSNHNMSSLVNAVKREELVTEEF